MECRQIPAAHGWSNLGPDQIHQYREHLSECSSCRQRVIRDAPDELLFRLEDPELPEEFWIGFWPSLHRKMAAAPDRTALKIRIIRWAAAVAVGAVILLNSPGKQGDDLALQPLKLFQSETYQRPLVEEVQNPNATYYIFQSN
ncbi:MAG TPA: hypothetical protein VI958_02790, partial [Acidobacteriota bacterium]